MRVVDLGRPRRRARRAPIDTTGARRPTDSEFRTARDIIARSGILPPLREALDSEVGRPRSLTIEALLTAFMLNALRRHHQAHLVEVVRTLNSLSAEQLETVGIRRWDPARAYNTVERLFVNVVTLLEKGWEGSIDGTPVWIDVDWAANRLVRAAIPDHLLSSKSVAVDGTDVETWGALHGEVDTIELDGEPVEDIDDMASGSTQTERRSDRPKRRAKVLGIGPEGRKIYTADPDARAGHRSATNSRPAGKYVGYELHAITQTRDLTWSDGVERVTLGPDVTPFVTGFALSPAGYHRGQAVVPTLIAAKENGQAIEELTWDPGYSLLRPEATSHPLNRARITQTFRPTKYQRKVEPFSPDALLIEGQIFSALMPEELRGPLPMPPRGSTVEERLAFEKAFNRRARWRYTRHAGPDADGTTRWKCPFHSGLLRSRTLPHTMRASPTVPLVQLPEGAQCCSGTISGSAAELPRSQPLSVGTTAWRISMGRRQLAEAANSMLKGHFVDIDRGFFRVFGRAKLTFLLGFTIAAYNVEQARSFQSWHQTPGSGSKRSSRTRAKRRKGTWTELIGPPPAKRGHDPPPG